MGAMDLVDQLFGSEQITGIQIKESLVKIVSTIDSSSDTATMTTMAEMSSWAVLTDKLKLSEVAEITEGGSSHPLFFSVLQVMSTQDKEASARHIKEQNRGAEAAELPRAAAGHQGGHVEAAGDGPRPRLL